MTDTNASVLVAGGAITVLVCPFLAQTLLARKRDATGDDPDVERVRG